MPDADQDALVLRLQTENMRLRRLLDEQGTTSTLRHQVRNALGLMRAITRRSAEGKGSVKDFAAHLSDRFDALLRVQTALLSSPDSTIELAMVVAGELLALDIHEGDRASIEGPSVRVGARQAELLGLVLHELATNAIKFGAMTAPHGHIDVSWTLSPEHTLTLRWVETGLKHSGEPPSFRGFGMEAIEGMLPYQLKAQSKLEFLPQGLRCSIGLPLVSKM